MYNIHDMSLAKTTRMQQVNTRGGGQIDNKEYDFLSQLQNRKPIEKLLDRTADITKTEQKMLRTEPEAHCFTKGLNPLGYIYIELIAYEA